MRSPEPGLRSTSSFSRTAPGIVKPNHIMYDAFFQAGNRCKSQLKTFVLIPVVYLYITLLTWV